MPSRLRHFVRVIRGLSVVPVWLWLFPLFWLEAGSWQLPRFAFALADC